MDWRFLSALYWATREPNDVQLSEVELGRPRAERSHLGFLYNLATNSKES
jgi:hypothetical protein